ncbi:MAG TPA: hypothetical protein PK668_28285 [Myxococcota bacterium]|nr:hypothetical protein [Myxococcota bacterium]HRY97404.1 hypothetical protein [Myxococcota bacterium]HSA23290.1 hypothetical protein [Myxococcota bacterium]
MPRLAKLALAAGLSLLLSPPRAQADGEGVDPDLAAAEAEDGATRPPPPPVSLLAPQAPVGLLASLGLDMSLILDVALGWFTQDDHLRLGGHAPDHNGFTLQGLEWVASAAVDPYFRFDLSFQLAHLELEEAYLTTLALPWSLQARLGVLNAAFGRENPRHLHTWHLASPSLMHARFLAEEHFGGLGGELSWLLPLPWYLLLLVEVLDTHALTDFRSSSFAAVAEGEDLRDPGQLVYLTRLESFVPGGDDWSLALGASGAWGPSVELADTRAALYGLDLYLRWRPLSEGEDALAVGLTLEYVLRDSDSPEGHVLDHGGYVQLDVQLDRRWLVALRADNTARLPGEAWGTTALATWAWRGSAAVSFLPTHFSKLRLQADLGRAPGMDGPYAAVFLQLEISAGAHGAHAF